MYLSLKEIQENTFQIMKKIDAICSELGLTYVLFWGSLIGAVRHKGFIPWDDDLDIAMPRPDYEKLKAFFIQHNNEYDSLKLFCQETRNSYPFMLPRICDLNYHFIDSNMKDYGLGTFVDIYPFDGDGDGRNHFLHFQSQLFTTLMGNKIRLRFVPASNKRNNLKKRVLWFVSKIISFNFMKDKLNRLASTYSYDDSSYVAVLSWMDGGLEFSVKKDDLFDCIRVPFNDASFFIPKNFDALLRKSYGNYMELPPENERIGHHYYQIEKR